ncbi:FHA domain-containing protein [Streptomyces sp. TRM76323]|uniref:FHA domain-containing protein n=1 Tax=Streptomyces tamarix TaxID=3078565 RepID=A0ABU3QSW7_9ACTN|nr:FHA domain-containing protein [Streptomyces tamarix]MDT9685844.1 FHA domain-containing protein [Streptomyces tamarix]
MPTCPNGHQSGADDWCEVCGHRMAGAGAPAGAVPPPPPPPPPPAAPGYGYPGPSGGDPHATQQAELCPQCRTPREAMAPFCEECRWNFLTNTATSYTPISPPPPPSRPGGGLNLPPGFTSAPRPPDPYEYQGSRPSQVNRPAEPLPAEPGPREPSFAPPPGQESSPFDGPRPDRSAGPDRGGPAFGRDGAPARGPHGGPGTPHQPFGPGNGPGPAAGGPSFGGHPGGPTPGGPTPGGPAYGPGGPGHTPGAPGQNPGSPGQGPGAPGQGSPGGPGSPSHGAPAFGPGAAPASGGAPGQETGPGSGGPASAQAAPGSATPRAFRQPDAVGDDDWVLPPPSQPQHGQHPQPPAQGQPPHGQAHPQHPQGQAPPPQPQYGQPPHGQAQQHGQPPQHEQPQHPQHPQHPQADAPAGWAVVVRPDREYFMAMMRRSGPEAASLNLPAYSPERRVPLTGQQVTVGRRRQSTGESPDIDLSVPPEDPGVSHQHAVFVRQPDGSWVVMDQNSTNGTTVNGSDEPIQPYVPVPLQDGDRVHVGAWTTLTVVRG